MYITCIRCGCIIEHGEYLENPIRYCVDCIDKVEHLQCSNCKAETVTELIHYKWMVLNLCVDCKPHFPTCDSCGTVHNLRRPQVTILPNGDYKATCADCMMVECEVCGYRDFPEDMEITNEGEVFCMGCYQSRYSVCLEDWSFVPCEYHFYGEGSLYMGIELEVDYGYTEKFLQNVGDYHPELYYKDDCSLNNGVEVVSHPCTLDHHCEKLKWESLMDSLKDNLFEGDEAETAGLHVHVNRTFFGKTEQEQDFNIAKVLLITDVIWEDLVDFSGRIEIDMLNEYAAKTDFSEFVQWEYLAKEDEVWLADELAYYERSAIRRSAVNILNRNTIEFRFFQSTLEFETLKARLQFIQLLCEFAVNVRAEDIRKVSFSDIVGNSKYKELNNYLIQNGFLTAVV